MNKKPARGRSAAKKTWHLHCENSKKLGEVFAITGERVRAALKRHPKLKLPVLAVGHGRGDTPGCGGESDVVQQHACRFAQSGDPVSRLPELEAVRLGGLHGQRDVFLRCERGEDAGDLE